MSLPSADELKGKWQQQVAAAKIAWGKLTEDELLESQGHTEKLAGLVQERYAVSRDAADQQVKSFLAKLKYCAEPRCLGVAAAIERLACRSRHFPRMENHYV